jgi:Putative beta-barrel porin-2, OmpL-like. bbp2
MFCLCWRQLSLCVIAILLFVVSGPSMLLAQSVPASHVAAGNIAAEKQVIRETSVDTFLLAGDTSSSFSEAETAQVAAGPSSTTDGNFFERLTAFYRQDWNGSPQATPPAPRRALPSPLDGPPFPSADWGYGGSPDIGASDGNVYPLMTALKRESSRTKIDGWVAPSINFSTSGTNNFPLSYDIFPNKIGLNQAVIYVERLPNTVQKDHFEFGYHFTAFYGTDYRFTTAKDYFSQQLLKFNRQYGFDPVLEYVDLYFPVKEGLNIRVGRFLSVPGIEAQLAPNNYNMTHSCSTPSILSLRAEPSAP